MPWRKNIPVTFIISYNIHIASPNQRNYICGRFATCGFLYFGGKFVVSYCMLWNQSYWKHNYFKSRRNLIQVYLMPSAMIVNLTIKCLSGQPSRNVITLHSKSDLNTPHIVWNYYQKLDMPITKEPIWDAELTHWQPDRIGVILQMFFQVHLLERKLPYISTGLVNGLAWHRWQTWTCDGQVLWRH